MNRRNFVKNLGLTGLGMSLLQKTFASNFYANLNAAGKVVVIGGGMAGTTVAKFLRLWGGTAMDVTLVEPNASYYSNIFSNMVLTGERTLAQLTYNYNNLTTKHGVKVKNFAATLIDPIAKTVTLSNGQVLSYDRLVLAPGIDFEALPMAGTDANKSKIVHAWKAGAQTTSLKDQIAAMSKSDTFILTIPPKPYRCPPGPYERACVVADYLKRKKGGGKVLILDANSGIQAEPVNFANAFNNTHKGQITYVPNANISAIDANTMTVQTNLGSFKGKVINAIPTHKAGNLISRSLTIQESSNAKQVIVGQKRVEFCQKIIFEFIF